MMAPNISFFSVVISENSILGVNCKDKISTKKCKKLKKKGKCKDKKTWKKCKETCKKCTPGTMEKFPTITTVVCFLRNHVFLPYKFKGKHSIISI